MQGALVEAEPGVLGFVSLLVGFVGFRRAAIPHSQSQVGAGPTGAHSLAVPSSRQRPTAPRAPRWPGKGRMLMRGVASFACGAVHAGYLALT